jgi:hypothetical protein
MSIKTAEQLQAKLQTSLSKLVGLVGKIQIGTKAQFPYGWGNAAKGRTVWRILEEVIIQNIKKSHKEIGIKSITPSTSEVSIHDFLVELDGETTPVYVNIKSAVLGGKVQKDDISKGDGLMKFYTDNVDRHFFVGTFFIKFNDDMSIEIDKCIVFPVAWIPDVYVNPSNNGNLQSSKYKDISTAVKRTNSEFFEVFKKEMEVARKKKAEKN